MPHWVRWMVEKIKVVVPIGFIVIALFREKLRRSNSGNVQRIIRVKSKDLPLVLYLIDEV
jgi:hypothetical protein